MAFILCALAVALSSSALFSSALFSSALTAQDAPNFAGTWTQIVDPNAPPPTTGRGGGRGGGLGGLGNGATISQDEATLTIVRTTQLGQTTSTYKLDGSTSTNTLTFGEFSVPLVSTATWDGATLKISTTIDFNGNAIQTTMALSLDDAGGLVVDSTTPGFGGGAPTTTKTSYKKG
jgi:hypothetical protein